MKIFLNVTGIVLIGVGGVWILQGVNILPGSYMSGQSRWTVNGSITALIGFALLVWAKRVRRKTH
jgi:drug/metabolite transporter superfamily protein YnfA